MGSRFSHRVVIAAALAAAVAACADGGGPAIVSGGLRNPAGERDVPSGGAADDATQNPYGEGLTVGLDRSPGWNAAQSRASFDNFCDRVPNVVWIPPIYQETDAVEECGGLSLRPICFRSAVESDATHTSGEAARVSTQRRARITWRPPVTADGLYSVQVWLPELHDTFADDARYTITHTNGEDDVRYAQVSDRGRWAGLGIFRFAPETRAEITLDSPSGKPVIADALRLLPMPAPNMTNAAWLAWFSANEYSHFRDIAPAIEQLGFGNEGEGTHWRTCSDDLRAVRVWAADPAKAPDSDTAWMDASAHPCLAAFATNAYAGAAPESFAAMSAAFQHYLIQTVHPDAKISFFSGGEYRIDEDVFVEGTTQAMLAVHRTRPIAIVAFRGTELREEQRGMDVGADARFFKVALDRAPFGANWGNVHRGFLAAYESIEPLLLQKIRALPVNTQIYVTGHSLGAALAALLSARLLADAEAGTDVWLAGLYTFGSPRVGDSTFQATFHSAAARYGTQIVRTRNNADGVTRIPFSIRIPFTDHYLLDYAHVGSLLYIDAAGRISLAPANVSSSFTTAAADHSMVTYYQRTLAGAQDPALDTYDVCPAGF